MTINKPASLFRYGLLSLVSLAILFPLVFAFSVAIQGETVSPVLLPPLDGLDFGVFQRVFIMEPNMLRWIANSFVVSIAVTFGQIITSALAAYALAMFRWPGRHLVFMIIMGTLMIPWESTIIANYLTIATWHLKDTYWALALPFLANGFGIFLLRQSFKSVPRELQEAATLEGCSRHRYLWVFLMPLSKPAVATLAVYTFLNTWNQYYWPLLVIDNPVWRTTQVGITAFRSSEIASFDLQMAATLIVLAPTILLLILGQKPLVQGLTAGALKG